MDYCGGKSKRVLGCIGPGLNFNDLGSSPSFLFNYYGTERTSMFDVNSSSSLTDLFLVGPAFQVLDNVFFYFLLPRGMKER